MIQKQMAFAILLINSCATIKPKESGWDSSEVFPQMETDNNERYHQTRLDGRLSSRAYNVRALKARYGKNCIVSKILNQAGITLTGREQVFDSAPTDIIVVRGYQSTHEMIRHFLERFSQKD